MDTFAHWDAVLALIAVAHGQAFTALGCTQAVLIGSAATGVKPLTGAQSIPGCAAAERIAGADAVAAILIIATGRAISLAAITRVSVARRIARACRASAISLTEFVVGTQ